MTDCIVAVTDAELGDGIEQMFCRIGGIDVGGAGVGTHAEDSEPSGSLEVGVERELILDLRDPVRVRPGTREVDVVGTRIQAGAHYLEIGGRKSRIQNEGTAETPDGAGDSRLVSGLETDRGDSWIIEPVRKKGSAGGYRVGDDELLEHRFLHEFEGGHGPHRAGAQHQDSHKLLFSGGAGLGLEAEPPRPPRL